MGHVESAPAPTAIRRKRVSEDRMLDAARWVFARDGYQQARMDAVAAKAGVTKVTLYSRFGSKLELFRTTVQRDAESLQKSLFDASARLDREPFATRLHGHVDAYFAFARNQPDAFRILFVDDGDAAGVRAQFDVEAALTERIAAVIAGDLNPTAVGPMHRVLAALVIGATHHGAGAIAVTGVEVSTAAAITESFLAAAFRGLDLSLLEDAPVAGSRKSGRSPARRSFR